jgi:hypothetical protein
VDLLIVEKKIFRVKNVRRFTRAVRQVQNGTLLSGIAKLVEYASTFQG